MTERDGQELRNPWETLGIGTDVPYPARVYDYLLGGSDNFTADREAAELSLRLMPELRDSARANRKFLARAVRFLRDSGIRQFLDLGTGLPTSPSTPEIAQSGNSGARVVCVDNDPVVVQRAGSLMAGNQATMIVHADLRDVDSVLAAAGKLLDWSKPVALLCVACLHNIPDSDEPAGIVTRYLERLAPGSYLAVSHVTDEFAPERMHAVTAEYTQRGTVFTGRSKQAILHMFNDRELLDPGLVLISQWRPDDDHPGYDPDRVWGYCGVARL
jgi:trans-aconitate methyltransferase